MAKTLVDLPDGLIEQAMEASGATTKREAVVWGLEALVARRAQLEFVTWLENGGLPDLGQPDVIAAAQR